MKYNKLVRDNIPKIIEKNGDTAVTHKADEEEYKVKLREKLMEEVAEFVDSEKPEELVDILEVVYAFCDIYDLKRDKIEEMRQNKNKERGGFGDRIILDETK